MNHFNVVAENPESTVVTEYKSPLGIEEKTYIIQEDYIQLLACDDGSVKNIYLIDKTHIHKNSLQVINQYEPENGTHANRYDVTILVNGLPM
ncbi:MAG: hypothetical protein LLF81_05545 [Porphyromonadaceae bacterium]|nr:hypothetical protein [Porphyromonadaceae bacterium]